MYDLFHYWHYASKPIEVIMEYVDDELDVLWENVRYNDLIQHFVKESLALEILKPMDVIIIVGQTGEYVKQRKEHLLAGCAIVVREWVEVKSKGVNRFDYDPVVRLILDIDDLIESMLP